MNNNFLIKTLVKHFGEARTIKMLNLMQRRSINKKAKRYRAELRLE
ncbi:hypothetical protein [Arachidicoccus ginsenosidimutans]|nr:hypothetical protein [Arachidicoccus sp. BS20]